MSSNHPRYIVFEDVSPTPAIDKDGKPYKKYKLKVQGLDTNGLAITVTTTTDIFVYANSGFMFCSEGFVAIEPQGANPSLYNRNLEEIMGFEFREETTNKRYEDWFIEKDSAMKNEVDGFINALPQIVDDANYYINLKTLVENSAADIWNQAVTTVQANNNANPDDRPLYWGRLKMAVALKTALKLVPRYAGKQHRDVNELILLFEEKSRNYTGVDFSNAPVGAKKILIVGFDPFGLDDNIKQSNPSGCAVLALHNTPTPNGQGYIQSMIVPVRYTDFDSSTNDRSGQGEGIVEKYIKDFLDEVDMIITISQSLPGDYNIDVFATATRRGGADNLGHTRMRFSRSINIGGKPELEWLETSLPSEFIGNPVKYDYRYKDENNNLKDGSNPNEIPPTGKQMKEGSGGNYLSNELFYRVALIRERWLKNQFIVTEFPTGHFHIAKLQETTDQDFDATKTQKLISTVKDRIKRGVLNLTDLFTNHETDN